MARSAASDGVQSGRRGRRGSLERRGGGNWPSRSGSSGAVARSPRASGSARRASPRSPSGGAPRSRRLAPTWPRGSRSRRRRAACHDSRCHEEGTRRASRNPGRECFPTGGHRRVSVHDTPDKAPGKAIPHGSYDASTSAGRVSVDTGDGAPHQERVGSWHDRRQRAAPGADGGLLLPRRDVCAVLRRARDRRFAVLQPHHRRLPGQPVSPFPEPSFRAPNRASSFARCCTPLRARDVTSWLSSLFRSACPSSPPWGPSPPCRSGSAGPRAGSRRRRP